MAAAVLWLLLTVLWVGLQCVIVVFHDHTHLLFCSLCPLRAVSNGRERYFFYIMPFPLKVYSLTVQGCVFIMHMSKFVMGVMPMINGLTLCPLLFCRLLIFFKINFFKNSFRNVKQFGSRLALTLCQA